MRQLYLLFLLPLFFSSPLLRAQVNPGPDIAWQQCYGGSAEDLFADAALLEDGRIVSVIGSSSFDSEYYGSTIILSDVTLDELWRQKIGDDCNGSGIREISVLEDNYVLLFGIVSGCEDSIGSFDYYVVKINLYGEIIWSRLYGSTQYDDPYTILPTSDGGFLVGGSTRVFDGDLYMPAWNDLFYNDALIMKMDSLGEVEWVDIVGGTNPDLVSSNFLEVSPGQYLVMIVSSSYDYDLAV